MTLSEHIKQKRKKNGLSQVELAFLLHFTRFFVTLSSATTKLLRLGKKRNKFLCFALDFS